MVAEITHDLRVIASHCDALTRSPSHMMLHVRISLDRIGAQFSWLISDNSLARLRRSIVRGELGPARILEVKLVVNDEASLELSAVASG